MPPPSSDRPQFGILREHCPFPHLRPEHAAAPPRRRRRADAVGAVLLTDFSLTKTFTAAGAAWVPAPARARPRCRPLHCARAAIHCIERHVMIHFFTAAGAAWVPAPARARQSLSAPARALHLPCRFAPHPPARPPAHPPTHPPIRLAGL